ncbi:hypothetical protein [Chryseobacterium sp. PET-29]|uniref:hypothetical protein n=1 Tax=Chryseobacterium sp. PET-29 TaxID=2983267 RepID=UPI0021E5A93C|nr:hypothetical protein [Chryseobacterium sp. PET-29]
MKKKHIIFTLILFSYFFQSQIKLNDKAIESVIVENSNKCFNFYLDEKNTYINFGELTKDEGFVPTKLKFSLSDTSNFNKIMNSDKKYDYLIIYKYKFTINGLVFYNTFFRYTSQYDKSSIKLQVDNINLICAKIKKGKFISPQIAENIARKNGFENIDFQSIENQYYKTKSNHIQSVNKDVWIFKEEKNKRVRTLVINAKNGKILTDYQQ